MQIYKNLINIYMDLDISPQTKAIYSIVTLVAIYLSIKRNGGINLGSFLAALFFPWIYIVYYFATQNNMSSQITI